MFRSVLQFFRPPEDDDGEGNSSPESSGSILDELPEVFWRPMTPTDNTGGGAAGGGACVDGVGSFMTLPDVFCRSPNKTLTFFASAAPALVGTADGCSADRESGPDAEPCVAVRIKACDSPAKVCSMV